MLLAVLTLQRNEVWRSIRGHSSPSRIWRCIGLCLAGLLCALHPVHFQAVNYLSSGSETMCMALVLWSLVLCQRPMSSAAVVLLPMAVLLEWRRPAVQRRWRGLIPHAILTVVYLSVISEHRLWSVVDRPETDIGVRTHLHLPFWRLLPSCKIDCGRVI